MNAAMNGFRRGRLPVLATLIAALVLLIAGAQAAQAGTLSVGDASVTEGGIGAGGTATFTVTLSEPSVNEVQANFQVFQGTALAVTDYITGSGFVEIPAGETEATFDVLVTGDALDEPDETFSVQLTNAVGATIAPGEGDGVGTILDDDPAPAISVADATVQGGAEGTGANRLMIFTATLSAPSAKLVTVAYETQDDTATANQDYQPKTGTLSFTPGVTSLQVTVVITADSTDELDERVRFVVSNPTNVTLADPEAVGTIPDDDGPTVSVADLTVPEPADGASTVAEVVVSLTAASPQAVSVAIASANDTAATPEDYAAIPANTRVTIPAGSTSATFPVTIHGDGVDEADERLRINLTAPEDGALGDGQGTITIIDDDETPVLLVDSVTVPEGTGGASTARLAIGLSAPSGRQVLVGYRTANGSAAADVDYQAVSQSLAFAPGETRKEISIPIAADGDIEEDETFVVEAFTTNTGSAAVVAGTVTIADDDLTPATTPGLIVSDAIGVREGDTGSREAVFTVRLERPLPRRVTVRYATVAGSATAPGDFTATSGTLTIPAGETVVTVRVPVRGDTLLEGNHSFRLVLSDAVNARLDDPSAIGVIIDDDAGLDRVRVAGASVPAAEILCRAGRRCAGLRVGWRAAVPGTFRIEVTALLPAARAPEGKKAPKPRLLRVLRRTYTVKAGEGVRRVKVAPGATAERLRTTLRRAGVRDLRVTVTFTNRRGGQQTVTFRVPVRLS